MESSILSAVAVLRHAVRIFIVEFAADKLVAEFPNGVLETTAPVAVAALPRRIEVKEMKTSPPAKYVTA